MAEFRGLSGMSGFSQYSNESVVLNKELTGMSAMEQELFGDRETTKSKVARFDIPSNPVEEMDHDSNPLKTEYQESASLQTKLRDRLYNKPEDSEVLQYVHMQTRRKCPRNKGESASNILSSFKRNTVIDPLPTNVPKRSLSTSNNQHQSSSGLNKNEVNILQNIITRKRPGQLEPLDSSRSTGTSESTQEGMEFKELDYDDCLKIQEGDIIDGLFSPTPYSESVSPSKTETSSQWKRATDTSMTKSREGASTSEVTRIDIDEADDGDEDNKYDDNETKSRRAVSVDIKNQLNITEEEPVEFLEDKSLSKARARSKSAGVETKKSTDSKKTKLTSKSLTSYSTSTKPDSTKVPAYLKRNKYDDTAPENTDAFYHLLEMRKQLGWVTEIPRHGPDTRGKMEMLGDRPVDEKEAAKTKEDNGEFLYCLPRNRNNLRARYNPYDLQVVSANKARSKPMYFTISASYVTMCYESDDKMGESNATPVLWWLWERRLFYMVFQFPVFVKFRLWKAFKNWKKAISHKKIKGHQEKLYKSLFLANEVLQGCLIHVKSLCEGARNTFKNGDTSSIISFVNLDPALTLSLQEFESRQKNQCDKAFDQLTILQEKIIEIVWESCATVAEMEGITQGIREEGGRKVHIKSPAAKAALIASQKSRLKIRLTFGDGNMSKKEEEEKKNKPLYAEIAEWRKILARLSCFLQCVDYVFQDLLHHLVFSAAQRLLDHLVSSYHAGDDEDSDEDEDDDDTSQNSDNADSSSRASTQYNVGSSLSFLSENKNMAKRKEPSTEPYLIPQYDFDRVSEIEGPPDADEVLEEIRRRDIIEEVNNPVFKISLVLNVPTITSSKSGASDSIGRGKKTKGRVKWSLPVDHVKEASDLSQTAPSYPQREESNSESESDSEYETGDSEESDEEEDYEGRSPMYRDHYAYPDQHKEVSMNESRKAFVSLSPSATEFQSSIQALIGYFEDTVTKVTPMLRERRLAVFYSPPKNDIQLKFDEEEAEERREMMSEWPDLDLILHDDPAYQRLLSGMLSYMDMEMELLEQYITNYDTFCLMVDQSKKMHVEESIAKKPWSTDEFNQVLGTHTEMLRRMKKMPICRRVAMVQVNAQDFCDSCKPYPQTIVDSVNTCLPVIANKQNDDLITIIKGASKRLDKPITSVEEFVEHLSFLGRMSTELPALEKEYNVVNKMFTIARDYNIMIQPEDMALYQTLASSFQHLKTTILYCEAKKDDNIRKFSTQLDTLIGNIRSTLMNLKSRVQDPELLHNDTHPLSALETIRLLQEEVQTMSLKARSYASYQDRFGSSMSRQKKSFYGDLMQSDKKSETNVQEIQTDLSEIERDLTLRGLLWQSLEEWTKLVDDWTTTSFDSINVEGLQKNVNKFTQTVYMLEKGLPNNEVVPRLKEKVVDFKQSMPVITSLRNPSLRQRHWEEIQRIIGKTISRDKNFTLGNLMEMNIFKHKDKIQEIATTASNEATLELMLQKVIDLWLNTDFRLIPHAGRDTLVIYGADDIMAQLEESQVTVGTIHGSRYVSPIKALVEEWERKLQVFSRTLDEWLNCQRNWLYLEQIFSTQDIQRQLPGEYKLFMSVDKAWKDIMRRTEDRPNALKSAITPGTLDTLQTANANLEKVQKCLEDYLETKRFVFPRFYFLSNDELLDILAQSKDPNAIQPHLGKCFGNIKALDIRILPRQPPTVKSIISAEKEIIAMPRNVRARGAVEQWLGIVESGMFETVKKHLKLGLADWVATGLKEWVTKHPGQVVLIVIQIMFNKEVTKALEQDDARAHLKKAQTIIVELLNHLASFTSARLFSHQRMSIEALLTITVHNRDIITELITNKVRKKDDFEWKRQLRYEWDETTNNCQVLQSNAAFQYGYEYLGSSNRLVITPLTDRCFLTLTGALHLHLGGSPAGPAGTGKTETVKDLSKAMGKQCVVFNCSEGLDYKMLGKFFSGLAQSGSWCCFDEFNRIDIEVLSVVAMQIHTIKTAKDAQALRFMFEGRDIKLNSTCGYFITMNPTYAGRVELPDNLKYLFRPVAMMVPDYVLIAEIMLFSEGFIAAKSLSQKIVNLYQLASKQLSQQDHYDFGMRAIKSVLVMAGHGRRAVLQKDTWGVKEFTEESESHILIHSLRDANMPKFLAEDVPLFESILDDLFPGITPPEQDFGALEKAISMSIRDYGYLHWANQIDKVKQLYSQIMVRHGVMLVGPTGGGKTAVRNILQKALIILPMMHSQVEGDKSEGSKTDPNLKRQSIFYASRGKKGHVETFIINPKCVKLGELYGETDPNTFEWYDGLIANATRKFSKDLSTPIQPLNSLEETKTITTRPVSNMTDVSMTSHTTYETAKTGTTSQLGTETAPPSALDHHQDVHPEEEEKESNIITDWRWLILDGPVDTLWVENLNTVLDDSKVLCLASGERISLAPGMRLLFEVDNLSKASPATISRCAMVYVDPADLGWKPSVKTWLNHLPRDMPDSGKNFLSALFDSSIDKGLNFLNKFKEHQAVKAPDLSIINTLCHILSAYVDFLASHGGFGAPDRDEREKEASTLKPASPEDIRNSSRSSSRTGTGSRASKMKRRQTKKQLKLKEKDDSNLLDGQNKRESSERKTYFMEKYPTQLTNLLGKLFVFAFTWSIGGVLNRREFMEEDDSSVKRASANTVETVDVNSEFDNFVRELFDVEPPLGVRLPAGNRSIYGYFIDMEGGSFVPWDALIPSTKSLIEKGAVITIGDTLGVAVASNKAKPELKEAEIIPTVDILRFSFLISLMLLNKHPVLLSGESGVGKTALISHMLKELEKDGGASVENTSTVLGAVLQYSEKQSSLLENISSLTSFQQDDDHTMDLLLGPKGKMAGVVSTMIQCSAQTDSKRLQAQIMLKLIKKSRSSMGAPKGRKIIVFVDDLNMPAPEVYGAQPPLELLRQFLELGGFYDTKKFVWKDIYDVTVVAACGPPGGGRNTTSPRLLKHFCLFTLPQPSTKSLQHIYQVQLGRFLQEGEFMPEVADCLFPLVSASIAVYYSMCLVMLPTPTKSHYTFNIRDLSKVVQGLLQAHDSVIVGRENCAQLFAHEATRVFHDRLTNPTDRQTFFQILSDNLHDYFKVRWSVEKLMNETVLFGDFFDMNDHSSSHKIYRPLSDPAKLVRILEEYNMRMSLGEATDQLVFFKNAVEHIVRAARVFRQPGGHLLLVGMDGTGKSTIVHLASYIGSCELFRLKLHNQYSVLEFREDLKMLFMKAGVKGISTVFLLADSDIVKESFLEDVNSILNSGEVPDLFDNEELDGITMELKSVATEAGVTDTRAGVYAFFIQRIRQKLHLVLTMSPAGDKFRQRCRMNPALISCCTIDWFDEWTDEAMISVANVFFANTEFIADESRYNMEDLKERAAHICVDVHKSIAEMSSKFWEEMRRRYYSTPSSYMELIRLYSSMLKANKNEFMNNRNRLQNGLSTLSNAYSMVGVMQEELISLGPEIVLKAQDTEKLLEQLKLDQEAAQEVQDIVSREESIMSKETQLVQDYADECESDLASVLPVLQNAITSLETLDKASISEIRVYTNPPTLVGTVISAVCVLFQKKTDWSTGKLFLGDPQFLKMLLNFDRNNQPEKVYTRLKKYTQDPNFNPEAVGKVSIACKCICMWVMAIDHYNSVLKMVKPKQKKVQDAREALKLAQDSLAKKQASMKKIQAHLEVIKKQYQDSVNQKEALQERQKLTKLRLDRASVLISALADEEVRWSQSVKFLDMKLEGLIGDTLVAASSVAYLGAFTANYRHLLVTKWLQMCRDRDVPISKDFDLIRSMADANQVMKWHNTGLPRDKLSTENATFVRRGRKWPLFIDPQGQAVRWVREMEGRRLKIVSFSDPNMMRSIENAIKVGDPILLKDVGEELDPAMRPVLLQETTRKGGQLVIKLGDVEIEFNENFRLYLTSSLANPHYLPAVFLQVNIINFTVTFDGLQEQLLSVVVKQERPLLEQQRTQLLESIANDKQSLRDLEDKSLSMLQSSEEDDETRAGNLLDDQDLIITLEQSKSKSHEIYERVTQSEDTEKKLNLARKRYLPVATRGSVIYFVVSELANIDVMYQYSLTWFQSMFTTCISGAGNKIDDEEGDIPDDISIGSSSSQKFASGILRPSSARSIKSMHNDAEEEEKNRGLQQQAFDIPNADSDQDLFRHLSGMIERLTFSIYRIVSVGLFSNHQLIFSFMLCSNVMKANAHYVDEITKMESIQDEEWQLFLHGSIAAALIPEESTDKGEEKDDIIPDSRRRSSLQPGRKDVDSNKPTYPNWISESEWKQCLHLEATFPAFNLLCKSLTSNHMQWSAFKASDEPLLLMNEPCNSSDTNESGTSFDWSSVSKFQRLLLIKTLRLEIMPASISHFIRDQLGVKYLSRGTFDLKEIYSESMAKSPLIFILSPGCDPSGQLLRFAKELRGSSLHLDMISLGRGQGPKAEELISKAQILKGRWVFLQNCHLAASWMPKLQSIVEKFNQPNDETLDPQFRLWLSSRPDPSFPVSILQSGIKMTVESPRGLRSHLLRTFGSAGAGVISEKLYNEGSSKRGWRPLLFGLCLFNSVIHERKKYGTLGWNIPYEFNDSDLEVSILKLQMLLEDQEEVPWTAISYLTGDVIYGGRVTDDMDRRCLIALISKFYSPASLEPNYCYDSNHMYPPVPDTLAFNSVISFIEELPNYDMPDIFGMTENAEKACREFQSNFIISTIISVQPQLSSNIAGSKTSSDVIVLDIATDISQRLPYCVEDSSDSPHPSLLESRRSLQAIIQKDVDTKGMDKEKLNVLDRLTKELTSNSALLTVLRQEIDRFNNLLRIVHQSLNMLRLAVKGEIVMSEQLENAYEAMLTQCVPQEWKNAAYESTKTLSSWVTDLVLRIEFFSEWAQLLSSTIEKKFRQIIRNVKETESEADTPPVTQPTSFWLPAFFFPQGFLTAVLQNHARKQSISVDSLTFKFQVTKQRPDTLSEVNEEGRCSRGSSIKDLAFSGVAPSEGVLVYGLFLDGARWDPESHILQDCEQDNRFYDLPDIHFEPVEHRDIGSASTVGHRDENLSSSQPAKSTSKIDVNQYECPLYRTSARAGALSSTGHSTNFVTSVTLPSEQEADFWILRGVAMLCQLDD